MAKSGSETRRRTTAKPVRFTPDEVAVIAARAQAAGVRFGTFVHDAALGAENLPRRASGTDREALARLLDQLAKLRAELGKQGSNLNQIAHAANLGKRLDSMLEILLELMQWYERDFAEMRLAVMQVLGYERRRDSDRDESPNPGDEPDD